MMRACGHPFISSLPPAKINYRRLHYTRSSPLQRRLNSSPLFQASSSSKVDSFVTVDEVRDVAASRGLHLVVRTLGPGYRVVIRDGGESGSILAVTTGFTVQPLGLMHCDTLQIYTKGESGDRGARVRGGILGLGLLIGGATFAFAWESGCSRAEILAINDNEYTHQRLVRYYSRFGFVPVASVTGGSLSDLPHMLVWGGVGTRMDAEVAKMLQRWSPAIRNSRCGT